MTWFDCIYLKIVSETSETKASLDLYGVEYMLSLYEGLTLKSYVESLYMKDSAIKREDAERLAAQKKMLGG